MSDSTHLLAVTKESGEILFLYCDKYNVYCLYSPYDNDSIYLTTMDKGLNITRAEVLETPKGFFSNTGLRFFKPVMEDYGIRFDGHVEIDGEGYRFTLTEQRSILTPSPLITDDVLSTNYNLLPVLKSFDVKHGIMRLGKFYFTGFDNTDGSHPVYGVVDLASGKFENIYYLYSDLGEIMPSCVSIDQHEHNVYVVGKTVVYGEDDKVIDALPYIEKFFYRS